MATPTNTLPSGADLPQVGFGTYDLAGETLRTALRAALDAGYTHIDTAEGYQNEAEIGEVLTEYDRDELFITSKILPKNLEYESVMAACERSLDKLNTEYLDLYLIHWPNPAISLRETLNALGQLHRQGKVRDIGVSNFTAYQLSVAQHISPVPIAVNQLEYHPWFARADLVEYCQESDIVIEAAAPLARTQLLADETLQDLADQYGKTPAQIALRWAVEHDVVPLPKSSSPDHIAENVELFGWELGEPDRALIDDLDRDDPVYTTPTRDWADPVWGIAE